MLLLQRHVVYPRTSVVPRNQAYIYVRPGLPCRRRNVTCKYALLDAESAELLKQLASGTMLSALSTSVLSKASKALARRAAIDGFATTAARLFQVHDKDELQDLLAALILSECVYKKLEMPPEQLGEKIAEFAAEFPPELVHIEAVQLSLEDVPQNYLVAVGGRSVYVAFMGTKQARDISTDLAFNHEAVWAEQELNGTASEVPSAHRGFLARSKVVPIHQLQALAEGSGRRLVLCGHSLGGAVAKLVGLRLLRESPAAWPPPCLRVVCFATPAVGNNALASLVEAAGWGEYFKTYVLPEDQLMRMLRFTQASITPAAAAAASGTATATGSSSSSKPSSPSGTTKATAATDPTIGSSSSMGRQAGSSSSSSWLSGGAVGDVLLRPFTRESAKETLRKELRAEEATTSSYDTAALDAGAAAAPTPPVLDSSSSSTAAAAASAAVLRPVSSFSNLKSFALSKTPWGHQQQQQQQLPASIPGGSSSSSSSVTTPVSDAAAAATGADVSTPVPADAGSEHDLAAAAVDHGSGSSSSSSLSVNNLGVIMQLQRRWVLYQLQQMGRAAMSPLSTAKKAVSVFHPFGQYCFISHNGVHLLGDSSYDPDAPFSPQAAAWQEQNPGYFSFHRMVAYRTRCIQVIAKISADLAQQGLLLPSAAAAAAGSSSSKVAVRVGSVVPAMRVDYVIARPPLRSPGGLLPVADGALLQLLGSSSSSGSSHDAAAAAAQYSAAAAAAGRFNRTAAGAAAGVVRRGPLAFLPGSSSKVPEPTVQLQLKVHGSNLHYCRKVGFVAFGEQYKPAFLARAAPGQIPGLAEMTSLTVDKNGTIQDVLTTSSSSSSTGGATAGSSSSSGGSSSSMWAPLSLLSPAISRVKQAAVAAAKAVEGERPRWKVPTNVTEQLTITVLLPVSVVERLTAAAGQQQQQSDLILQLKSDFEVVSVPVQLQQHCVGVVGSSVAAAALLCTLLSSSGAMQQQYQQQLAVASAAAAAAPGSSLSSRVASLRQLLPQRPAWINSSNIWQQQQHGEQQQQQSLPLRPPVQKLKAAASLTAAAGASVAASRLATLSRQLLGRRGPGYVRTTQDEPAAKRVRTAPAVVAASGGSSSMSSMSSYEEGTTAAAAATLARPVNNSKLWKGAGSQHSSSSRSSKDAGSSGSSSSGAEVNLDRTDNTDAAAAAVGPAVSQQQQQQSLALQPPVTSSSSLMSRFKLPGSSSSSGSSWRSNVPSTVAAAGASARSAGLKGVVYKTLPIRPSMLPVPQGLPSHSLPRVLWRATKHLQQQAKEQHSSNAGLLGLGFMQRRLEQVASAAVRVPQNLLAAVTGSSSSNNDVTAAAADGVIDSSSSKLKRGRSKSTNSVFGTPKKVVRQQQQQSASGAVAPSSQQQQQRHCLQHWDVLVLAVTWDADLVQLLKHRSALSALAAAAAAAGVQIVPVLLLEDQESVMSVTSADLVSAGMSHLAQHAQHDGTSHSQQQQQQQHGMSHPHYVMPQGLLRLDDAAAELAAALHIRHAPVLQLPVQGLLNYFGSSSGSGTAAANLLGCVGGLAQQHQLLVAVQKLEGRLAGVLQSQHSVAVGLQQHLHARL